MHNVSNDVKAVRQLASKMNSTIKKTHQVLWEFLISYANKGNFMFVWVIQFQYPIFYETYFTDIAIDCATYIY